MPFFSSRKLGYAALIGAGCAVAFLAALSMVQHKIIYLPRRYAQMQRYYDLRRRALATSGMEELKFAVNGQAQKAYFISNRVHSSSSSAPNDRTMPLRLWVLFGGNAALALDWGDLVLSYQQYLRNLGGPSTAFLLIDYPGYGDNDGAPSPSSLLQATDTAVRQLAAHLNLTPSQLQQRIKIGVMGHSLGCAAALQWMNHVAHPSSELQQHTLLNDLSSQAAAEHRLSHFHVDRAILVSPFTSILEMAHTLLGPIPFLRLLLKHNFDNRRALAEFAAKRNKHIEQLERPEIASAADQTSVLIFHGARDEIVPVIMGRQLAEQIRSLPSDKRKGLSVEYHEIPDTDHNFILDQARTSIFRAMALVD